MPPGRPARPIAGATRLGEATRPAPAGDDGRHRIVARTPLIPPLRHTRQPIDIRSRPSSPRSRADVPGHSVRGHPLALSLPDFALLRVDATQFFHHVEGPTLGPGDEH